MNFKRRISESQTGFQMGPMLDIIFILLIQFMVATMFANREDWFKINVPTAQNGEEVQGMDITEAVLNVRADGEVFLELNHGESAGDVVSGECVLKASDWGNGNVIGATEKSAALEKQLRAIFERNPELKVVIRADSETSHGKVVALLDICSTVNIRNIAFSTQKQAPVQQQEQK